jgi:ribonuclease III
MPRVSIIVEGDHGRVQLDERSDMTNGRLADLCRSLDHDFKDQPLLLRIALTHSSATPINNERLEFLGDALLGFIIAEVLYQRFPQATEGELTRLRSSLVKRETLAMIARRLEIGHYLTLGEGEEKSGGRDRDSILANALESIIGAIYLDGGFEVCRKRVIALFEDALSSLSPFMLEKDPKTRLQEFLQARRFALPTYDVIAIEGEPHKRFFTVRCTSPMLAEPIVARDSSRRRAEQAAACKMLERLRTLCKSEA